MARSGNRVRQDGTMQEREAPEPTVAPEAVAGTQAAPAGDADRSQLPAYGTRESAAGLPYPGSTATSTVPVAPHPVSPAQLAAPGQRLLARLVDIVVVGVLLVIVETPFWLVVFTRHPKLQQMLVDYVTGPVSAEQAQAVQDALSPWATTSTVIVVVVWFLYEVPLMARRGQTLGKRLLRIRATSQANRRGLGWRVAMIRWVVLGIPTLFSFVGMLFQLLDSAWLLWDTKARQCLHDKPARTVVVRASG
ncbi:MAG: RDD family protein [Streptosporangiales bacterium]